MRHAEQETPPFQTSPPEFAKHQSEFAKHRAAAVSEEGEAQLLAEGIEASDEQAKLRAIASDLLYWKNGLKVLRQAQLPKWRGHFKWQLEAKIETLQIEYARLRAEVARQGG